MAETFGLEGVDQLLAKLNQINYETSKKGGRRALRLAAQVIRDAAKSNAQAINDPETAESIYRNIAERWNARLNKRTGDLGFRVGVLGGARIPKKSPKGSEPGGPGGDTRYWAFVEFGTEHTAAQPFMVPAMAMNTEKAASVFISEFGRSLDKAIKKGSA